jgi:glycosyltransferase involved in cell wall biosynthesis
MNDGLIVSIWCVTYNHEKYIRDAIEGFLMQKTNFNFEIVIHDDASTDGTIDILMEYEKKYPELIRVIYETENQYSKFSNPPKFFFSVMQRELRGKYIAMCEGDDYWIDTNKLQMQVDYMENHPDCVMTGHDIWMLNCQTGSKDRLMIFSREMDILAEQFIGGTGDIATVSLMFRSDMLDMDDFFLNTKVGDDPLKLYCFTKGSIHYFDRPMSVYRYLSNAESWSSTQINDLNSCFSFEANQYVLFKKYNMYTNGVYIEYVKSYINKRLKALFEKLVKLSEDDFYSLCQSCEAASDYEEHKYYAEMINLYKQYTDETYLSHKVSDFIKKCKHVFIYGAGVYGKLLAKQMQNNDIEFDGFVVSDDQSSEGAYEGKKVWKFGELSFIKKEMGIVIAVRPYLIADILTILHNSAIENYIYPFRIDCEEWIMQ